MIQGRDEWNMKTEMYFGARIHRTHRWIGCECGGQDGNGGGGSVQICGLHTWSSGGIVYGGGITGHGTEECFGEKQEFCFAHIRASSGG